MKLYEVIGNVNVDEEDVTYSYGLFSTKEKAEEIQDNLLKAFAESGCEEEISIIERTLDVPEILYDYVING